MAAPLLSRRKFVSHAPLAGAAALTMAPPAMANVAHAPLLPPAPSRFDDGPLLADDVAGVSSFADWQADPLASAAYKARVKAAWEARHGR
jgi:hypothetical protein